MKGEELNKQEDYIVSNFLCVEIDDDEEEEEDDGKDVEDVEDVNAKYLVFAFLVTPPHSIKFTRA